MAINGTEKGGQISAEGHWPAIWVLSLTVTCLSASEALPATLLTPLAADLNVSVGAAGQAVTATAIAAVLASLFTAILARGMDRRWLVLSLVILQVASNILVAMAPSLPFLVASRVLLGICVGGFWSMSTALVIRLVPGACISQALGIIFLGASASTILATPLAIYAAGLFGWRAVFWCAAGLSAVVALAQFLALPSLAPATHARIGHLGSVLTSPGVAMGMLAILLVFGGTGMFRTYLRPFLETESGVELDALALVMLAFGIGMFVGSSQARRLIGLGLRRTIVGSALAIGAVALLTYLFGGNAFVAAVAVSLFGLAAGVVPVSWSTWIARTVPEQAETAGGLQVAAIQGAFAIAALFGGLMVDLAGPASALLVAALLASLAGLAALVATGKHP